MNTQEREFAPRGTSLLSYSQAIGQMFFCEYFMVRRGIFVHPFEKYPKREHKRILVGGGIFFVFCVSILGWVFLGVIVV